MIEEQNDNKAIHRLLAILAADAVGYSARISHDPLGTVAQLDHARQIFREQVSAEGGRVIDTAGDSVLASFKTCSGAMRAALRVQEQLAGKRSSETPDPGPLIFRVGVHLGDVVVKRDGTVYGDGVNVAARLQSLCNPGEVLVSDAARAAAGNQREWNFCEVGLLQLKGFTESMRGWRLLPQEEGRKAAGTLRAGVSARDPNSAPSLAVVPFRDLSPDSSQAYFAEGLAEELTTALGRIKFIRVVASSATFAFAKTSSTAADLCRQIGAEYLLTGSVRRSTDRIRINAQLVESSTQGQIWAQQYDGRLDDIFEMQEDITLKVVNIAYPTIEAREIQRARNKPAASLTAYDLYLCALPLFMRVRESANRQGLVTLEQALASDPNYVPALCLSAFGIEQRMSRGWSAIAPNDAEVALRRARQAIRTGDADASMLVLAANSLIMIARDFDSGLRAAVSALRANPSNAFIMQHVGFAHLCCGDLEVAVSLFDRCIALTPHPRAAAAPLTGLGMTLFLRQQNEEAIACFEEVAGNGCAFDMTYVYWCCACAAAGQIERAHGLFRRVTELLPGASLQMANRTLRMYKDSQRLDRILVALRLAGAPDH